MKLEMAHYVQSGGAHVLVHNTGCGFTAPHITVNRHGQLTNGRYTLDSAGMTPHTNGTPGKSQFGFYVNSGKATLDAAAYADRHGLWVRNKAKVPVVNGVVGYLGDGRPKGLPFRPGGAREGKTGRVNASESLMTPRQSELRVVGRVTEVQGMAVEKRQAAAGGT